MLAAVRILLDGFAKYCRASIAKTLRSRKPVEELTPIRVPVLHLRAGEEDHRARLPLEIYPYSAGIKGGIAGGFVMAALATIHGIVLHGSPWYTINLLAAAGWQVSQRPAPLPLRPLTCKLS